MYKKKRLYMELQVELLSQNGRLEYDDRYVLVPTELQKNTIIAKAHFIRKIVKLAEKVHTHTHLT